MSASYWTLLVMPLLGVSVVWILHMSSAQSHSTKRLFTKTPAVFNALKDKRVLNVHIVPHTHDDVGWLKTVEQYYYGFNSTIQHAHVQAIIDSVVTSLDQNPHRTFTYVESKFFSMWWNEQSPQRKEIVRKLVAEERLAFVNGGWCMHDEASTHFMGMIDQTTLGHAFLKQELGVIPTVGWQLDPFGHASSQASYMTSLMGFDALYFGRIDYQDLQLRHDTRECEGIWDASPNIGNPVFWGLTGSYLGNYGTPGGFCFDSRCNDDPIVGLSEGDLLVRVNAFVQAVKVQSDRTKGNEIMLTFGEDFNYENAEVYHKNIDLLINATKRFQESGQIDITDIFGNEYDLVNLFYSTPVYYTEQKQVETAAGVVTWSKKVDDFFPYADNEQSYWTGYFTSRTGFKRLERVASSFLMAARQIESIRTPTTVHDNIQDCTCMQPLHDLDDAMGVVQHHDAVSGTAKQHVANDYAKRVQAGLNTASEYLVKKMKNILLGSEEVAMKYLPDFGYCQLLNETTCDVSESASTDGRDMYLVIYNGLSTPRSSVIRLPIAGKGNYEIVRTDVASEKPVVIASTDTTKEGTSVLYFDTGPLPQTGAAVFKISSTDQALENAEISVSSAKKRSLSNAEDVTINNGIFEVRCQVGEATKLRVTNLQDQSSILSGQRWGYYTSFDSNRDKDRGDQNSGAYIFRPSAQDMTIIEATQTHKKKVSELVEEIHIEYTVPWIREVIRLYKGRSYMEVEYTVGPIPIEDGVGKEVVSEYFSSIKSAGVFYTDSNGREFQQRVRSQRPTWNLTEHEPVAGNFYPVNAAIYIEDDSNSMAVVTDRSQGGASLKNGRIQLMVQRRTLRDDWRGVDEPLNETDGGVTPYPPHGDATRYGEGITVSGKHRVLFGLGNGGAQLARSEMDDAFAEPLVFVGSASAGEEVPFIMQNFSLLANPLPLNVMLITFSSLPREAADSYLIRLGHQYAAGEDPELSEQVTVDLHTLFDRKLVGCQEKTLSGNRNTDDWEKAKYDWTPQKESNSATRLGRDIRGSTEDCILHLAPMEIRTLQIQLEAKGKSRQKDQKC